MEESCRSKFSPRVVGRGLVQGTFVGVEGVGRVEEAGGREEVKSQDEEGACEGGCSREEDGEGGGGERGLLVEEAL